MLSLVGTVFILRFHHQQIVEDRKSADKLHLIIVTYERRACHDVAWEVLRRCQPWFDRKDYLYFSNRLKILKIMAGGQDAKHFPPNEDEHNLIDQMIGMSFGGNMPRGEQDLIYNVFLELIKCRSLSFKLRQKNTRHNLNQISNDFNQTTNRITRFLDGK